MDAIAYKTVIGLDIGQHSVKAVRAVRRGDATAVTPLESLRVPPGMGPAETASLIGRWLDQQGIRREPCVVGIRGLSVLFQTLALPPQDPRPADQAVAMEIARLSEISSDQMRYGYVPISGTDETRRFLLALVRADKAEEALQVPREAGADVVEAAPAAAAAFHAAVRPEAGGLTAVADIGLAGTDVAIGGAAGLRFARSFGLGGQYFTEALAKARRMTVSQAEPAKIAAGLEGAEAGAREALAGAADAWAAEFASCLSIYKSFFPNPDDQPVRLVLTGGGSRLKGLERRLAGALEVEVRTLAALPGQAGSDEAPAYAVACGLALIGAGRAGTTISLLPPDLREAVMLRRQKKYWLAAAALAGLVLGVSLLGGYRDYRRKTAVLRAQRESLSRCQALAREIERGQEENARLSRMTGTVQTLLRNGPRFRDVLGAIGARLPADCWITLAADANTYFSQENPVKPEVRRGRAPGGIRERKEGEPAVLTGEPGFTRLIVEGYTSEPSLASVKALIGSLKDDGVIQAADLLGDDQLVEEDTGKWGSAGGRRFVIDLTL